jgi:hypothetical protein
MKAEKNSGCFYETEFRFYGRKLNQQVVVAMIQRYFFIECGEMRAFLDNVCGIYPDRCALIWLSEKADECLKNYDNGNEYFRELRILKNELEYALSIEGQPV